MVKLCKSFELFHSLEKGEWVMMNLFKVVSEVSVKIIIMGVLSQWRQWRLWSSVNFQKLIWSNF